MHQLMMENRKGLAHTAPSKLKVGAFTLLGEGFAIARGQRGTFRLSHDSYETGIHIWRKAMGLVNGQWQFVHGKRRHTQTWFYIYDGEGGARDFRKFREAIDYAKTQVLAVLAARRLGYQGGKVPG